MFALCTFKQTNKQVKNKNPFLIFSKKEQGNTRILEKMNFLTDSQKRNWAIAKCSGWLRPLECNTTSWITTERPDQETATDPFYHESLSMFIETEDFEQKYSWGSSPEKQREAFLSPKKRLYRNSWKRKGDSGPKSRKVFDQHLWHWTLYSCSCAWCTQLTQA